MKDYTRKLADKIIILLDRKLKEERDTYSRAKSFKAKRESTQREIKLLVDRHGLLATNQDHLRITIDSCKDFVLSPEEWNNIKEEVEGENV